MERPTMKSNRKVGFHIIAFCLGALAPLPLLMAVGGADGRAERTVRSIECHRHPGSTTAMYLYPLHSPIVTPNPQDVGWHFIHTVPERYVLVDSTFPEERESVADPGS